jgi:prophage regulatory protein
MGEVRLMRVLRRPEVERATGKSRSEIYEEMDQGLFPLNFPISPGGRAVGWLEEEILKYVAERVAGRDTHIAKLKAKREERQKRATLPPPKPSAMAPPKLKNKYRRGAI